MTSPIAAGHVWSSAYSQSARYSTMPAPPASARSAKTSRTSVTSTPSACAIPPQTPASARSEELAAKAGRAMGGSSQGALDANRARPHAGIQDERAVAGLREPPLDLPAARLLAEHADVPGTGAGDDLERDARR